MQPGIGASRLQADEQEERKQDSDPELQQHDEVEPQDQRLKRRPCLRRRRSRRVPDALVDGRDEDEADEDDRRHQHHCRAPEDAVAVAASGRDQDRLGEQEQKEGAHQHGMQMEHDREWRALSRLHRGDLGDGIGDEPGQRDRDEARRREDVDPPVDRPGDPAPRSLRRCFSYARRRVGNSRHAISPRFDGARDITSGNEVESATVGGNIIIPLAPAPSRPILGRS